MIILLNTLRVFSSKGITLNLRNKNVVKISLIFIVFLCAITTVVFYFLHINQGYNLSDEGNILLSGAHPNDVHIRFSSFDYYLNIIMFFNKNIVFLRCFTVAISILILSFFSTSVFKFFYGEKYKFTNTIIPYLMLSTMICIMSGTFCYPMEPHYNNLSCIGSILFISILLYMFVKQTSYSKYYSLVLGFIFIFILCNKFSTAFLLLFLFMGGCAVQYYKKQQNTTRIIFYFALGALIHLGLYIYYLQDLKSIVTSYEYGFQSMQILKSNHDIIKLIIQNTLQCKEFVLMFCFQYKWLIYAFIFLKSIKFFSNKMNIPNKIFHFFFLCIYLISSIKILLKLSFTYERFIQIHVIYFAALMLLLFIFIYNIDYITLKQIIKKDFNEILSALLIMMVPFMVALGSNNPIMFEIIFSVFIWGAVIVCAAYYNIRYTGQTFGYLLIACICIFATYNGIVSSKNMPFGLNDNLLKQNSKIKIRGSTLYVDAKTAYIINSTREQLIKCGFKNDDYILSLTDVPGLNYAVGARSPSCSWYWGELSGANAYTNFCLRNFKQKNSYFILLAHYPGQSDDFHENNLHGFVGGFPNKYKFCGKVENIPASSGSCCKPQIDQIKIFKPVN